MDLFPSQLLKCGAQLTFRARKHMLFFLCELIKLLWCEKEYVCGRETIVNVLICADDSALINVFIEVLFRLRVRQIDKVVDTDVMCGDLIGEQLP